MLISPWKAPTSNTTSFGRERRRRPGHAYPPASKHEIEVILVEGMGPMENEASQELVIGRQIPHSPAEGFHQSLELGAAAMF
jgi:hypothetical protein